MVCNMGNGFLAQKFSDGPFHNQPGKERQQWSNLTLWLQLHSAQSSVWWGIYPQEPWLHKGADIYIKGEWKLRNLGKKNNYFTLWNFTLECVSAVIRLKTLRTRWNGKVYIRMSHLSILMDLLERVWVGSELWLFCHALV